MVAFFFALKFTLIVNKLPVLGFIKNKMRHLITCKLIDIINIRRLKPTIKMLLNKF